MSARRMLLLATAATFAAGCGAAEDQASGDRSPYEELVIASDTAEGFGTEQPAGVTPVQGGATIGGALTATGNLRGTREDAPPGNVTVTEAGDQTRLLVSIQGWSAGTEVTPSLVRGRCGEGGQVVHQVNESISADATGIGSLDTTIPVATQSILDGQHSIRLTLPDELATAAVVLACADLPQTAGTNAQ